MCGLVLAQACVAIEHAEWDANLTGQKLRSHHDGDSLLIVGFDRVCHTCGTCRCKAPFILRVQIHEGLITIQHNLRPVLALLAHLLDTFNALAGPIVWNGLTNSFLQRRIADAVQKVFSPIPVLARAPRIRAKIRSEKVVRRIGFRRLQFSLREFLPQLGFEPFEGHRAAGLPSIHNDCFRKRLCAHKHHK